MGKVIFGSIGCPIALVLIFWAYNSLPLKVKPAMISIPLARQIVWDKSKRSFQVELPQPPPGHLVVIFNDTSEPYVMSCQMDGIEMSKILTNTYNSEKSLLTQQVNNGLNDTSGFKIEHLYLDKNNDIPLVFLGEVKNYCSEPVLQFGPDRVKAGYVFTMNELIKWGIVLGLVAMLFTIPLYLIWSLINPLISTKKNQRRARRIFGMY